MTEAKEKPIVTLAELYKEYGELRNELMDLADLLPDGHDLKDHILETDQRIQDIIAGRLPLPPLKCKHCEKQAQMWVDKAKAKREEMGLADTEENVVYALKCVLVQNAGSHPVS